MIPLENVRSKIDIIKRRKELDKPEFDGDNVQLNVDLQSYREQSITDDSDNVIKNCN